MAGVTLLTPPTELLGCFLTPGQPEALRDWYASHASTCDQAIVSLDMMAFGGLVASRNPRTSLETAQSQLDAFLSIQGPPVLAFQSILRTAPTQTSAEDVEWASMLMALSQARDPDEIEQLKRAVPPSRLAAYRAVRERNHALNRWVVERVSQGRLAGLLLGIDDSKTRGWNVDEIHALEPLAEGLPVWITPGTDESAQLLLIRAVARERQLELVWSHPELPGCVTAYEDRTLGRLLQAQLAAAGLVAVESHARKLLIHGRLGPQAEARNQVPQPVEPGFLEALSDQSVVADVAYANGGDLSLLTALRQRDLLTGLWGYSAWNTAGNTIGTALASLSLGDGSEVGRRFLAERIGDDGLYQAVHRQEIQAELGHPGLTLSPAELARARQWLGGPFLNQWSDWVEPLYRGTDLALQARGDNPVSGSPSRASLRFDLPWQRLFEVSLEAL